MYRHLVKVCIMFVLQLYPFGIFSNDSTLDTADDPRSLATRSLDNFIFCGQLVREIYVSIVIYIILWLYGLIL